MTELISPRVAAADFRRACGQFATGVTVVTMRAGEGVRGMTANSFTSVSLEPPLVLVSIGANNRTHALLEPGRRFVVNVLAVEQRTVADRFAGRQGDVQHAFDGVPHRLTDDGLPVLEDTLAALVCRVVAVHPAGDHSLFIGAVEESSVRAGASPLVFFAGHYTTPVSVA